jgi:hypothetical protein
MESSPTVSYQADGKRKEEELGKRKLDGGKSGFEAGGAEAGRKDGARRNKTV